MALPPGTKKQCKDRAEAHLNEQYTGTCNAKRILFRNKDSTFTALSVSPENAEMLEFRWFSMIELHRLFNVPPPII